MIINYDIYYGILIRHSTNSIASFVGSVKKEKGQAKSNLGMRRPLGIRKSKIFNLKRTPNDLELGENILEPILQYHKRNLFVAMSNAYHLLNKTKFKSDNNVAPIFGKLKFSLLQRYSLCSEIYTWPISIR